MTNNKKLFYGVLIICILIVIGGTYWYFIIEKVPEEIKGLRVIEDGMEAKLGEKIIARTTIKNTCMEGTPGGCPIGLEQSEYFDSEFLQKDAGVCLKKYYTLITTKKIGSTNVIFRYACDNTVYKQYRINIVE